LRIPSQNKIESRARLENVTFGMWLFLASEVMFFTAFFAMVIVMRAAHPELIHSHQLNTFLASINSLVFLASLFFMNRAVDASKDGEAKILFSNLAAVALLGTLFLVLKSVEYLGEIKDGKLPSTNLFYGCYYTLTGFEGLHVLIGVVILAALSWRARRGDFTRAYNSPVEVFGLYWSLLVVVWFFILPVFYLD